MLFSGARRFFGVLLLLPLFLFPWSGPRRAHHGPVVDRRDQGHGRGEDPRREPGDAFTTRPAAGKLVRPSTLLTMPATIAHHAAGCRLTWTRATAAGMILDTLSGRAVDQRGPGDAFTTRPAAGKLVRPSTLLTMPATIAHHAAGCRSKWTRATATGMILDTLTWSGP